MNITAAGGQAPTGEYRTVFTFTVVLTEVTAVHLFPPSAYNVPNMISEAYMESVIAVLSGVILPAVLLVAGVFLGMKIRFFYILHPIRLCRDIRDAATGEGISPVRALTVALAGTLGVGNITGVTAAIACGGAGAVFWMWVCALLVMSVKYAEVYLSQVYRSADGDGGAMYYIRYGLSGCRFAPALAATFAVLIIVNSILTGVIVQTDAAVTAVGHMVTGVPPAVWGILFGVMGGAMCAGGFRGVSGFTVRLIPVLTGVFILVSVWCIIHNIKALPDAVEAIFRGAFTPDAAGGGVLGFGINSAVRYGVSRGIFSNEAGCGTSTSAHGAATAKSPHHQGCMGIFEVFADTIVLCTVTALVVLTSGIHPSEDGMVSALLAYGKSGGEACAVIVGVAVILFALATVVSQSCYGMSGVGYLTKRTWARGLYIVMIGAGAVAGSVIPAGFMWDTADLVIAVMTVVNTCAVVGITGMMRGRDMPQPIC